MSSDSSHNPEAPEQTYSRMVLEAECTKISNALECLIPRGMEFSFFVFDRGTKAVSWAGNLDEEVVVQLLEGLLTEMRKEEVPDAP